MRELVTIMGIDQSINSTGVCIYSVKTSNDKRKVSTMYYNILPEEKMKKKMKELNHKYLEFLTYNKQTGDDYESKELAKTHNIMNICTYIENLIRKYAPDVLVMEGISYGSTGSASLVDLSGLNFCIRMIAIKHKVIVRLASPMTVKKLATGNGGALKDEMIWAWRNCDTNIKDLSGIKDDDLADSYWLARIYETDYIK